MARFCLLARAGEFERHSKRSTQREHFSLRHIRKGGLDSCLVLAEQGKVRTEVTQELCHLRPRLKIFLDRRNHHSLGIGEQSDAAGEGHGQEGTASRQRLGIATHCDIWRRNSTDEGIAKALNINQFKPKRQAVRHGTSGRQFIVAVQLPRIQDS